jgi:hypothetical protein
MLNAKYVPLEQKTRGKIILKNSHRSVQQDRTARFCHMAGTREDVNTKKSYNLSDTSGEIKAFSVFKKLRIASKNV